MTQPLDRNAKLPELGNVDRDAGEIWVENPFMITGSGFNLSAYERNRVFLNRQGQGFIDASFATGADIDSDSRSVVAADLDRDGAPDLLVGSAGGGPLRLFRNRFPASRRTWIELVGTDSNRQGIGARVIAEIGGRQVVRDMFAANGGFGQGPVELQIGLGQSAKIDRLTVRWPTGKTQQFSDLPADRRVVLTEGEAQPRVEALRPGSTAGVAGKAPDAS